eukprot:TRINITY_DN11451_c0_g2_i4.p2 TRINITY_DN11451_c0_g2~~TRINITY_DN11451_c0_g2_i4.p2  ORF type:complete len:117 (+),score=37.38 TRINITY_DN11451_c0_g2_i4:58-408(+)
MEKKNKEMMDEEVDDTISKPFAYKSIIDRYYNKYYHPPTAADSTLESKDHALLAQGANLDQYVFLHSNKYARVDGRIALVGISKKHSAVKGEIERVVLRDYEDKKMTGKRKRRFCC